MIFTSDGDRAGLDAEAVLASLPEAGDKSPSSPGYGLIWRVDSYRQPNADDRVALTVAGLRHLLRRFLAP